MPSESRQERMSDGMPCVSHARPLRTVTGATDHADHSPHACHAADVAALSRERILIS